MRLPTYALLAAFSLAGSPALAQEDSSRWGVSFSGTPHWETLQFLGDFTDTDTSDLHGSEFTVGIIRGASSRGDWGVSFVRRTIASDSSVQLITRTHEISTEPNLQGERLTFYDTTTHTLQSASLLGVEVHKYAPFLKTRYVQAGITFAGGIAKVTGTTNTVYQTFQMLDPETGQPIYQLDTQELPAHEVFDDVLSLRSPLPIGRIEATVAIRATSQFKVKIGGGMAFPGKAVFRVGGGYLF